MSNVLSGAYEYESAHTKFMREWMQQHPEELEQQKQGRALWWDKPQDLEQLRRDAESQVKPGK